MRIDQYLVEHHGFTRNKAKQLIESGLVFVDARVCSKPSFLVPKGAQVNISDDRRVGWVSRSAEKLAGFLEQSDISSRISGSNCLDVGSSTGGFTQVLLSYGAAHIDAVDVGSNQLHSTILCDPRVSSYEQTDIRDFSEPSSRAPYGIIVCDASFISLHEIIDVILSFASVDTDIVLLYKPQFEVGREALRKTGVPRDTRVVEESMKRFETLLESRNTVIHSKAKSTLMGEAGNQEWIYHIQKIAQSV